MMRTLRVVALAAMLASVASAAFGSEALKMLGVFGGVNLGTMKFDPEYTTDTQSNIGPAAGVIGLLPLGDKGNVAIRLSPMWIQKGGKFKDAEKEKWSYVEVPLYMVLMPASGNMRPYVMIGPSVGFLLSAKEDDEDIKDDFTSTSISARGGVGVCTMAGRNTVFVEGEYELGLQDVLTDPSSFDVSAGQHRTAKTNGIRLNAGVTFPFAGM
jgi:hypothetical protein